MTKKQMSDYEWSQYCDRLRVAPAEVKELEVQTRCIYIIVLEYKDKKKGWMKVWVGEWFDPEEDEGASKLEAEKHLDKSYHMHEPNATFTGEVRLLLETKTTGHKVEEVQPMWVTS